MKTNIIFPSVILALNLLGSCTFITPKKEETRNPYIPPYYLHYNTPVYIVGKDMIKNFIKIILGFIVKHDSPTKS